MALHGTRMELDERKDAVHLRFELPEEPTQPCRHRTEAYSARIVRLIELATGVRPRLPRVAFRHRAPESVTEHERLFATKPSFGAPRNEVVLEPSVLSIPLVRADPRLSRILDQHVRELAARTAVVQTLTDQVRRYVRDAFPHGDFGVDAIGRRTGLGARTLQRRLKDEGTSHRDVLEQARHELALRYLVDTRMPIKEVASVLGYSELRAFYRAFERWTGLPPAAYRRTVG